MADPRPMKEWQLHTYVAGLLRLQGRRGVLSLHIANEGMRSVRTGAFLKRLGMLPGAADFLIVIPPGQTHFLELKTAKGRSSPEQRAFADMAAAAGCRYAIAHTPEQAKALLTEWGALQPETIGDIVRRASSQSVVRRVA